MPPVFKECPPGFDWDESKRLTNALKHGYDLAEGWKVFCNTHLSFKDTRKNYGEERWITLGWLGPRMVVLVHSQREGFIRLISMRKANDREKKRYQKRLGAH